MVEGEGRQPEWRTKRVQVARILIAFAAFSMLLVAWTAIITGALHFDLAVTPRESSPGGIGIAGAFGLAIATLGAFFGAQRFLQKRRDTAMVAGEPVNFVQVDEGGLRWRFEERRGYLPFRAILDVSHAGSFDDPAVLVKTTLASLRLPTGGLPQDLIINAALGKRPMVADRDADLLRDRRPLEAWFAEVRAARGITGEHGYRDSVRLDEHLARVAADRDADAEVRAAAVHAVLSTRDDDAIACIMQTFGSLTPPLVVVAAAIAAPERVDASLLEVALGMLSHIDEADARTLLAARVPHVRVEAPEVVEEIRDHEPESDAARMRR